MLYGHDEGKNIVQLCDGSNDTVCIARGGTGKTNAADALAALGGVSRKLLWQNASPTSGFAAQTVTVSGLEGYDEFAIEFKGYCQSDYRQIFYFKKGNAGTLIGLTYSDTYVRYYLHNRGFTFTSPNKLVFDSNYAIDIVDGKASASNTSIIPIAIYGIKGVQ